MALTSKQIEVLSTVRTIELTTVGRQSGEQRRIEIWWFHVDSRFVITGTPGRRDWLANVLADPHVVVHANGWDIPATVSPVTDEVFRRRVMTHPDTSWYQSQAQLERLVATAPMIEVHLSH